MSNELTNPGYEERIAEGIGRVYGEAVYQKFKELRSSKEYAQEKPRVVLDEAIRRVPREILRELEQSLSASFKEEFATG